jgi:hypothetical protein
METSKVKQLSILLFEFKTLGGLNRSEEAEIKRAEKIILNWIDEARQLRDEKIRADYE